MRLLHRLRVRLMARWSEDVASLSDENATLRRQLGEAREIGRQVESRLGDAKEGLEQLTVEHARHVLSANEQIDKLNSQIRIQQEEIHELALVLQRNRQRVEAEIALSAAQAELSQLAKQRGSGQVLVGHMGGVNSGHEFRAGA